MAPALPILNLREATFQCTYGRGCDGICCREGRPLVYADESERIDANLGKFLPLLRPLARAAIGRRGYLTRRRRLGQRVVRKAGEWCVFFNRGCVLHRVGAAEGDKFRYKPAVCALFPLQMDERDRWYVRQWGFKGEKWDLFCLDPARSRVAAADSLRDEIALARRFTDEAGSTPTPSSGQTPATAPRERPPGTAAGPLTGSDRTI